MHSKLYRMLCNVVSSVALTEIAIAYANISIKWKNKKAKNVTNIYIAIHFSPISFPTLLLIGFHFHYVRESNSSSPKKIPYLDL